MRYSVLSDKLYIIHSIVDNVIFSSTFLDTYTVGPTGLKIINNIYNFFTFY